MLCRRTRVVSETLLIRGSGGGEKEEKKGEQRTWPIKTSQEKKKAAVEALFNTVSCYTETRGFSCIFVNSVKKEGDGQGREDPEERQEG